MPMSRFSGGTLMRRFVATTTRPAISTSPALGFSKPATMRKRRCLAAAARSEQRYDFTLLDFKRDVIDGGELAK